MMNDKASKIAVVQVGGPICGIGDDEDLAIADAYRSGIALDDDGAACMEFLKHGAESDCYYLAHMTEALAREIERHGGGVPWTMLGRLLLNRRLQ